MSPWDAVSSCDEAVLDDLVDRHHGDPVVGREALEVRESSGGAVLAEYFADGRDRGKPGQASEIDGCLGVTAPFEHTPRACPEREHVARTLEVGRTGVGVEDAPDRVGAVAGTDAAARGHVVDRNGERGVVAGAVGGDHRPHVELVEATRVARHAHETPCPTQHEVDRVGRDPTCGHREVALVLAVFVVDDEHHLAAADALQGFIDGCE